MDACLYLCVFISARVMNVCVKLHLPECMNVRECVVIFVCRSEFACENMLAPVHVCLCMCVCAPPCIPRCVCVCVYVSVCCVGGDLWDESCSGIVFPLHRP